MIGRAFGKPHNSIHGFLSQHGGIVPPVRRRSLLVLTAVEREDISRGLASGSSIRDIAKALQRAASTVSREVVRHGGRPLYRANEEADHQAWESALRPKRCSLALHVKLRKLVASKLILDWSPQQISGWLKIRYPADESMVRVPRNDLPQFVHPGPRSAEERTVGPPAIQAPHPRQACSTRASLKTRAVKS